METKDITLVENKDKHRFELPIGDKVAYVNYILTNNVITLNHAKVPPELEGQGIGSALVKKTLDKIAERGWKVIPQCTFVDAYIRRHPEYKRLVFSSVN